MEGDVSEGKGRAVSRGVAAWDAADRQRKMRPETGEAEASDEASKGISQRKWLHSL